MGCRLRCFGVCGEAEERRGREQVTEHGCSQRQRERKRETEQGGECAFRACFLQAGLTS